MQKEKRGILAVLDTLFRLQKGPGFSALRQDANNMKLLSGDPVKAVGTQDKCGICNGPFHSQLFVILSHSHYSQVGGLISGDWK